MLTLPPLLTLFFCTGTRSKLETEVLHVRYWDFELGRAETAFFSLNEVDWDASSDEMSADCNAIFSTYFKSLTGALGEGSGDMLKNGLVSGSFDGANVMMGKENSVASKFIELAPQIIIFHAVAHRLELVWADACAEVVFMILVAEVLSRCYSMFSTSLKKTHGLKEMADCLDQGLVSLKPLHGIRWLASQCNAVRSLLRCWYALVMYLETTALASLGCNLTTISPRDKFLGQKFTVMIDGRFTDAIVVSCVSPVGTLVTEEMFKVHDYLLLNYYLIL